MSERRYSPLNEMRIERAISLLFSARNAVEQIDLGANTKGSDKAIMTLSTDIELCCDRARQISKALGGRK